MATEVVLDINGSNPFWPKNMKQPGGPDTPATNAIDIVDITFTAGDPTINVTTTPPNSAWTIDWGDGSGATPITAGTNSASHTYADKTSGKAYTVLVTSGTDTDSRKIQY